MTPQELDALVERCEADVQQAVDGKYRYALVLSEDAAALLTAARELAALKEAVDWLETFTGQRYTAELLRTRAAVILAKKEKGKC